MNTHRHSMQGGNSAVRLPAGTLGIDAGITLTKLARASEAGVVFEAHETAAATGEFPLALEAAAGPIGMTGALAGPSLDREAVVRVQEIEAAARGAVALLEADGRPTTDFMLALLGTGTAFAAVRDGRVTHLGGTALGGGSFTGIGRAIQPMLSYEEMIAAAGRGDRRRVDTLISDVYPEGIGRIGPELTAAHLSRAQEGSFEDVLAGLLNLHGENLGQIAASRAVIAKIGRIVLAGGFVHGNGLLTAAISSMARLFGTEVETLSCPGFAGALGAALIASEGATGSDRR